jgi:hypothetical protein
MNQARSKAESFILKYIDKIAPGGENKNIYEKFFSSMSDKEFENFIEDLESGKRFLTITAPNFSKVKLNVENNLKIAEELDHEFFQRLWIEGDEDTPTYLSPIKYLVVDLPVRRASQLLTKKISVPDHNKVIDAMTGQPTGESKGAKISYPELQVAAAMGLDNCMVELMKYRGGDSKGGAALNGMISKYGTASLGTLSQYSSGVESTKTLKTFLTCLHLKATL